MTTGENPEAVTGTTWTNGFAVIVNALAYDVALDQRHHDHALSGDWSDFRDCHVGPNLVLIYEKPDSQTLRFVRLGSHSVLGL